MGIQLYSESGKEHKFHKETKAVTRRVDVNKLHYVRCLFSETFQN